MNFLTILLAPVTDTDV